MYEKVDGLCGFYNLDARDDQRTPDGDIAPSTVQFGDSWSIDPNLATSCKPISCGMDDQTAAWNKCSFLK